MEIKYSNFIPDPKIFGTNEIVGLISHKGNFLYENIYDLKSFTTRSKMPVGFFLRLGANVQKRKLIFDMLSEFEIDKELQKRSLDKLSTTERLKVLIIKSCISQAKLLVFESLDTYFNYKDMIQIIKSLKNHMMEIHKTIVLTMNKTDNLAQYPDRYIVVDENQITYNGKKFDAVHESTAIKNFTALANAKGAKLKEYKEPNDLLKAIYRSVK